VVLALALKSAAQLSFALSTSDEVVEATIVVEDDEEVVTSGTYLFLSFFPFFFDFFCRETEDSEIDASVSADFISESFVPSSSLKTAVSVSVSAGLVIVFAMNKDANDRGGAPGAKAGTGTELDITLVTVSMTAVAGVVEGFFCEVEAEEVAESEEERVVVTGTDDDSTVAECSGRGGTDLLLWYPFLFELCIDLMRRVSRLDGVNRATLR
jgi:hypothetical protein